MEIRGRFNKGDRVYAAEGSFSDHWVCCPDCMGTRKWTVVFADGDAVEVECQTCKRGWERAEGRINIKQWQPEVRALTIGSIRFNDSEKEGEQFSYMCEETGIGSGRVYRDKDLFEDKEAAEKRAEELHEERMRHIAQNNFSKKFGGTKELEAALSTWGFSRAMAIEKAAKFRQWAKISKIIK